jgi:hypothetical protein
MRVCVWKTAMSGLNFHPQKGILMLDDVMMIDVRGAAALYLASVLQNCIQTIFHKYPYTF